MLLRIIGFVVLLLLMGAAHAQMAGSAQLEEVIVTGSRIQSYETDTVPVVHLRRRADFMITNAFVESDSRDHALRKKEVMRTIEAIEKSAKDNKLIALGLLQEFEINDEEYEFVTPFSKQAVERYGLGTGYRPDTTRVSLIIKTPISQSDASSESVYERLEEFIEGVKTDGRATVGDDGEPGLSIVNIAQYREPLLKNLARDMALIRTTLGADYKTSVTGLENTVRWRVVGPLELALYFPYASSASEDQ